MDIDVILCNHAEVAENKLFVTGGGINMCFVQPMPPHVVSVALGCVVHVPYLATNQGHTLEISLVDADGAPIVPWVPEGMPTPEPVKATQGFNMGRPPLIQMGDEQTMSF